MINKENSPILFRCRQRPNRNPMQTAIVNRGHHEDPSVFTAAW